MNAKKQTSKKHFKMPHIFIILFFFIAIMSIMSYIIPAGEYNRTMSTDGRELVVPDSFHYVKQTPVNLIRFLTAIPQGYVDAGFIIALTLCVGAAVKVVEKIGIIPAGVSYLARKFKSKGIWVIPILMIIFAVFDAFVGVNEMCLVYIPIIMPLMLKLGFDSITACATALCASAAGFSAAITNPFTVAIGQSISGLPLYSGTPYRVFTFIIITLLTIIYVMRYAAKIHKDPSTSSMYQEDQLKRKELFTDEPDELDKLGNRQKLAGIYSGLLLIVLLVGVLSLGWDMPEMCGLFIAIGVGAGVISGLSGDALCNALFEGCQDMFLGALIIGIARGIAVVMADGQITDTIVYFFSSALQNIPSSLVVVGMFFVIMLIEFFVPSGSGKAVILFPIFAPLSDIVGVTRQTTVLAYQFSDGFTNVLFPTSGYFMACITNAGVSWQKWVKFLTPLFAIWMILSILFLVIAQIMQYGPF